jgi:hypothetical protein
LKGLFGILKKRDCVVKPMVDTKLLARVDIALEGMHEER